MTVYTLTTLEQLRALSSPIRVELLRVLTEAPLTMAQASARLKLPQTKLYFHVAELERNGLVTVVATQTKGNLIEKQYQAVAEHFIVAKGLFRTQDRGGMETFDQSVSNIMDSTAVEVQKAIASGQVTAREAELARVVFAELRLSPERLTEFSERLGTLLEDFLSAASEESTQPQSGHLTLVFYPMAGTEKAKP